MKSKKKMFCITCSAYLLTIILDLLFTYIATPNLLLEGNPLYDSLNFGWSGLIVINVITFIGYVLMSYYTFIKYKPPLSNETDMKRYLAQINYGDPDKYVAMMWKMPKYWAPQIACLCWSVAVILPFARFLIVILWFFLIMKIDATIFYTIVASIPTFSITIPLA